MTSSQISAAIGSQGYSLNLWTDLSEFPIVFLEPASSFYTDKKKKRVRFNSTTSCMEFVFGKEVEGTFVCTDGETTPAQYKPEGIIQFETINGFIRSVIDFGNGTFIRKPF